MNMTAIARELTSAARELVGAEDAPEDAAFAQKVRSLKTQLNQLSSKKVKKLNSFGIAAIRPTATVEDLVDALLTVSQAG